MSDADQADTVRLDNRALDWFVSILAVLLTLGSIAWALDFYRTLGLQLYTEQYLGGMLVVALPLVFLAVPAGKGRFRKGSIPWYDALAALAGFLCSAYIAWRYPQYTELITVRPWDGILTAVTLIVLLTEGLRRTVGNVLTSVVAFFFVLALVGDHIPGELQGRPVDIERLVYYLAWDSTAILGTPMRIVTTIVVAFVLFGQLLFRSGGSTFFTEIAMVLMGRYRGGPAKISVFASGLFGSISGSVVSNVVTTGVITIPLMKKGGYKAHLAGAIEAVASTGGQLMPPVMGAAAFLMAEFLSIPYTEVVLAALLPAILYYVALFVQADLEAARGGIERIPAEQIPAAWPVMRSGWFFPLPFAVLIYALFVLNETPELSALMGAGIILIATAALGYKGQRLNLRDGILALRSTGLGVLDIFMIGGAAGIVIGVLNTTGLGFALTLALVKIASGSLILLLVMAAGVCILLGMGMPTVGVYVLLATLVAPALVEVGINEISAHLFILYFGMMSMITPPVCIGAFAAATLSESDPMRTGFAAMRFGWLAFVIPFMFVASPSLLMNGNVGIILVDFAGALMAAWLVSVGIIGYFTHPLAVWERAVTLVSGLCLILPVHAFAGALEANLVGAVLAVIIIGREFLSARGRR